MSTTTHSPSPSALPKEAGAAGASFNEQHVLHQLAHYLPSQTPLKDFIHHNSLHAFQDLKFYEAIFTASKIFGYQVTLQLEEYRKLYANGRVRKDILEGVIERMKGPDVLEDWKEKLLHKNYDTATSPRVGLLRVQWKAQYGIDLDNGVQPLLFRILCSYLDQGIALQKFPVDSEGFLASIRKLEASSFTSFFKTARAKNLLRSGDCTIEQLLKIVVGDEAYFEQYLFDQQFSHRGWSGIVCAIEAGPSTLLDRRDISLHDLIVLELLLEIDALDAALGKNWKPLASGVRSQPLDLFAAVPPSEVTEVFTIWQNAFEWSYYDEVFAGLASVYGKVSIVSTVKTFQALFCIDERECSLRRHIESVDPACETLGTPGFFGVEFFFQPAGGQFYDKLCPAPVTPAYLIKEGKTTGSRKHELLYTNKTHSFFAGLFSTITLGFLSLARLGQNVFKPQMSPAISNAFAHMDSLAELTIENKDANERENGLQVGFTVAEMAQRVEGLLRGTGLIKDFAPLIYTIAHGSSSANNPHHGAHDCGACSGRPGSVNARVFSFMANHPAVRASLLQKGISIPDATQFVGGLHDTAADQVQFYDEDKLTTENRTAHQRNMRSFEAALDLNAKERSRRFSSIDTGKSLGEVRKAILARSVSMFEPRPELGHGTNTLCIIGRRNMTKGVFLDRRAFLNSYDHTTDPGGELLTGIMKPIGPVCGGINLEYYFSRVDNYKLGAGTKLPHNVMGLIAVANSSDGDLRAGLPLQMIEVHDPVRLLVVVEHLPDVVLKVVRSIPEMYQWYGNEWVHLAAVHPETGTIYYLRDGAFVPFQPMATPVRRTTDIISFIESAKEMETNSIVDATKENLPVHLIN